MGTDPNRITPTLCMNVGGGDLVEEGAAPWVCVWRQVRKWVEDAAGSSARCAALQILEAGAHSLHPQGRLLSVCAPQVANGGSPPGLTDSELRSGK